MLLLLQQYGPFSVLASFACRRLLPQRIMKIPAALWSNSTVSSRLVEGISGFGRNAAVGLFAVALLFLGQHHVRRFFNAIIAWLGRHAGKLFQLLCHATNVLYEFAIIMMMMMARS